MTSTETARMTPVELSLLIRQHAPRHATPCRVCGSTDMQISRMGDSEVVGALYELRALREERGEDMTVPVGTHAFPKGHGKHRCYYRLRHEGDDRWVEDLDWEFTHDPSHAELDFNYDEEEESR